MKENECLPYFSKEIKKPKYDIKSALNQLKAQSKKKFIKDFYAPDEKINDSDFVDTNEIDFIEYFHENEEDRNYFFKEDILKALNNNIYINYLPKKEKDKDKKSNLYENLIKELITTKNNEEKNPKTTKSNILLGKNENLYKYYKIHKEKFDNLKKQGLQEKINKGKQILYNPNYDYIYKKIISGPKWKKITGRNHLNKLNSMTLSPHSKSIKNNDLSEKDLFTYKIGKTQRNIGRDIFKIRNKIKNKIKKNNSVGINKSIFKEKSINIKNILNKKKLRNLKVYKKLKKPKNYSDINKSDEKNLDDTLLNQSRTNRASTILMINYDVIQEKVKMMVNYNAHKTNNRRTKEFKGYTSDEFLDIMKSYKAAKGDKNHGLAFGKMTSRPTDKILPSFMCGFHSRMAVDAKLDKSLKLNNYSSSKFAKVDNYLIPRSFNKYVNLSLLKSPSIQPENVFNLSEFKNLANNVLPIIKRKF